MLGILFILGGCTKDEPSKTPSISIENLQIKFLRVEHGYMTLYNIKGTAVLEPEGKTVMEAGFLINAIPKYLGSPTGYNSNKIQCEIVNGTISFDIDTYASNKVYNDCTYVQAYMILADGSVIYSDIEETTIYDVQGEAFVTTKNPVDVGYSSAILEAEIELTENETLIEYGFFFGSATNPDTKIRVGDSFTGSQLPYLKYMYDLRENTKYYYQAYGVDVNNKLIKGNEISFVTKAKPRVTINSIQMKGIRMEGNIPVYNIKGEATLSSTGYEVSEAGFIFSFMTYRLNENGVKNPGNAHKIECDVKNDKISFDIDISDSFNIDKGTTYFMGYMIMSDGSVFISDIQKVSSSL